MARTETPPVDTSRDTMHDTQVFKVISVMCEMREDGASFENKHPTFQDKHPTFENKHPTDYIQQVSLSPHHLITDTGLIFSVLQQLEGAGCDGSDPKGAVSNDPLGSSCVVTLVHGAALSALAGLLSQVAYAPYLDTVASKLAVVLRSAVVARHAPSCEHLLACLRSLARCHPAVRAPFYRLAGLEAVYGWLSLEDDACSIFAAQALEVLAVADARPHYGLEIHLDLTPHYDTRHSTTGIKVLVQLIQRAAQARRVAVYVQALGALGRNASLSRTIDSENGVFVLVGLLSSAEACVVAATAVALAHVCTDPLASQVRSKIKMFGGIPCALSLLSSPDHLVQRSICLFLASAGTDAKLLPTFGKLDAVGQVLRLMDCASCPAVQAAAMRALANLVQSVTSAKRFTQLGGADVLHKALCSNDELVISAAATAIGAISARADSDATTFFADIREAFVGNSCYRQLLLIIQLHHHRSEDVTEDCMRVFEAFCAPRTALDVEFISGAVKILKARSEVQDVPRRVRLCAITVAAGLSKYASSLGKDQRKWLVTSIQSCLSSATILEKTSACYAIRGVWWDKKCREAISKGPAHLECVFEMLKDARSRSAAATALEGLVATDNKIASQIAGRGCTEDIYVLLRSSSAQEATQAAKTLASMSKQAAGLEALLKEIPALKKKEGIAPILAVIELHSEVAFQVACANCISAVVQLPKWTLKMAQEASPSIIRMLQNTHQEVVIKGAAVLTTMAKFACTHGVLRQEGAIITLNALLTDSSEKVRSVACGALRQLSGNQECNDLMLRIGTGKTLLDIMRNDTFAMVCSAAECMRGMLQLPNAQAEFMVLGGMQVLDTLLDAQELHVRKRPGIILVKVLLNPRNKAGFNKSPLFFKCLDFLGRDPDMEVRRTLCEALSAFAGNDAAVNIEYKTALYESGFVQTLGALLLDTRVDASGVRTRSVAAKALKTMCSIMAVQDDVHSMGLLDVLVPLLDSTSAQQIVATADVITRAVRHHVKNRQAACAGGLVKRLAKCLVWQPVPADMCEDGRAEESAHEAVSTGKHHDRDRIKVRAAAADALASLLECASCRRTYQGTRAVEFTMQGICLCMPSVVNIYDCPHREVCVACAQGAADCGVLDHVLDMLNAPEAALRNSAAHVLSSLAIGAPYLGGECALSAEVSQQVLEHGTLGALLKMLNAKNAFDSGGAAAEQFAAARAIDALGTRDVMREACCKTGYIKALVEMLFSTLGRVKGSAALALARLCATEDVCFFFHTQTEKTFWETPDDLKFVVKVDGTREYFEPDDVQRDPVRKGYWVRGIFKPYERVALCDMLVNSAAVKHGPAAGMHKMKADSSIVTHQPVLDLILDIFKSPIYGSDVNGWAAESCAIAAEFMGNRQRIAASGCVPYIVALLNSDHNIWKEQAAIGLGILMYDDKAKEIAASAGVMEALTEILLNPHASSSLKESAALALAKACWNAANQVIALHSGAMMPLIAMLIHPHIRQWCCGAEALMAMSNNNECRAAIGQAGAMPALVNKMTLHGVEGETAGQVRILGTLTNLVSVAANCDMAVDCGVLMRFIHLTESHDILLLNYLIIAMATTMRAERWRKRFVESGLVQALVKLVHRYDASSEPGQLPGAGLIRIGIGGMMRDLSAAELFKTTMVHLGALPALNILAHAPEDKAQAAAAATVAFLAFSDEFKDLAREAGLIASIAHLMRKRSLQVQLESAEAVRVLASNHKNKMALVDAGAHDGLRDMLDHQSSEARVRATSALCLLATNQDNSAALSKSGVVRPLVKLLDSISEPNVLAGAASVLANVTSSKILDTRAELAACGAIPKLWYDTYVLRGLYK